MEFKVGDRVEIIGNSNKHCFKIGDIVELYLKDEDEFRARTNKNEEYGNWVRIRDIELVEPKSTTIEITTKRGNTHLLLKEDGKVVKHTQAILHKDDEYDFETGVRLCVDRLFDDCHVEEKSNKIQDYTTDELLAELKRRVSK